MGPSFHFISLISTILLARACMAATTTLAPTNTTHETTTPAATTTESPETKTTPSESTTMEHTHSESPVPDTSTHEPTTPESTTTESTTTEATTPEATTSETTTSEATTPEATTPEATTQEATTPQLTTPEVTTPESTTPEATTSDVTTPQVTTPELTTPVPASPQTFGILDEESKTYCIVLVGKLEFEIQYMAKDGQRVARIPLPINNTVNGSCNYKGLDSAQQIILSFFGNWSFSVIIHQSSTASFGGRRLFAETVTYDWNAISLDYFIDDNFPNAQDIGKPIHAFSKPNFHEFKSKQNESYKCDDDKRIDIGDKSVTLVLSNFQYTAFAQQVNQTFENEGVTECSADKNDDDNHVGAIVGGVVGGTVGLIIIIGIVLYCRNRQRKDYVVM